MGTRAQNLGSSLEETIWRSWKHRPPSAKAEHQNSFRRISDGIIAKTANWPGVRNTPLWTMYIGLLLKWQWSPRVTSNFRNERKLGANQNFLSVDLLLGALNGRGRCSSQCESGKSMRLVWDSGSHSWSERSNHVQVCRRYSWSPFSHGKSTWAKMATLDN